MNGCYAIEAALAGTAFVLKEYLKDLADADLFVRPTPAANHIAWQLGHLIFAEPNLVGQALPDVRYSELPAGFAERYGRGGADKDGPDGFLSKAEYLSLFDRARATTIGAVKQLTDADLDRPTVGSMAPFAPTAGALLLLVSNHTLMHAGQFTVVRRKLGKPVLF